MFVCVCMCCSSLPKPQLLRYNHSSQPQAVSFAPCCNSHKQVKTAVPNVEERTYKKGALLVQQGKVPEGLFLILSGTCELVLLSHLPEPSPQQDGPHSSKPSFTTKIAAAVTNSGRASPNGLLRTQSSSPMFAMPPKRDADIDFAGALSDSDETSDGNGDEEDECEGSESTRRRDNMHDMQCASVQPGFPFFRLTASADGSRRPGGLLGGGAGRPWSPSLGVPPPSIPELGRASPIQEGAVCALPLDSTAEAVGGSSFFDTYSSTQQPSSSMAAAAAAVGAAPGQTHSWSTDGSPVLAATLAGGAAAAAPAAATAAPLPSVDGSLTAQTLSESGGTHTEACSSPTPATRRISHVKSCSVDFGLLAEVCEVWCWKWVRHLPVATVVIVYAH